MDIIEEFKQLVEIDSASGRERAIADVLKKKLTDLGFGVLEDQAGSTFGGNTGNLIAIMEGTREGSVLFCSHMDRVANGCGIHPGKKTANWYPMAAPSWLPMMSAAFVPFWMVCAVSWLLKSPIPAWKSPLPWAKKPTCGVAVPWI